jgi:hypothetical protein
LGPVLYLLYINDLPETLNCTIATFADDTAIMATGNTLYESTTKLQRATDNIATWTGKWRIKLHETKSTYINFTNQKIDRNQFYLMALGYHLKISIHHCETCSHEIRLQHHVNEEASRLLKVQHLIRRLERTEPLQLVKQFDI